MDFCIVVCLPWLNARRITARLDSEVSISLTPCFIDSIKVFSSCVEMPTIGQTRPLLSTLNPILDVPFRQLLQKIGSLISKIKFQFDWHPADATNKSLSQLSVLKLIPGILSCLFEKFTYKRTNDCHSWILQTQQVLSTNVNTFNYFIVTFLLLTLN